MIKSPVMQLEPPVANPVIQAGSDAIENHAAGHHDQIVPIIPEVNATICTSACLRLDDGLYGFLQEAQHEDIPVGFIPGPMIVRQIGHGNHSIIGVIQQYLRKGEGPDEALMLRCRNLLVLLALCCQWKQQQENNQKRKNAFHDSPLVLCFCIFFQTAYNSMLTNGREIVKRKLTDINIY